MPLTDLCIKRIIIIPKPIRFNHHHKLFSGNTNNVKTTLNMADEESNVKTSQFLNTAENEKNQDKKVEKSTASVDPPLPPPPEKPLPGDCCGSGCVRCVWDVYYEELEEYNKLCNPDLSKKSGK